MDIFGMHTAVVDDYRAYVKSFLTIAAEDVRAKVEDTLLEGGGICPSDGMLPKFQQVIIPVTPALGRPTYFCASFCGTGRYGMSGFSWVVPIWMRA